MIYLSATLSSSKEAAKVCLTDFEFDKAAKSTKQAIFLNTSFLPCFRQMNEKNSPAS